MDTDVLQTVIQNITEDTELGKCKFHVKNTWIDGTHNQTTITSFYGARQENKHIQSFKLDADEPPILAGNDAAPNPVEHLLNSLTCCVTTCIIAHAAVRGIHIEELESEVEGDIDLRDFLGISKDVPKGFTDIRMKFKVKADKHNMELLKNLVRYSPVFNTLTNGTNIDVKMEPK